MNSVKIAITGPESSGKSDLTKALASHFAAPFADEYAREYLARINGTYTIRDLEAIYQGQKKNAEDAMAKAKTVCFFDTEMLVLKIWSQYRFGKVPKIIEEAWHNQEMDLYLLCKPDIPWYPDTLRESPLQEERDLLFAMYKRQLEASGAHFMVIKGVGNLRVQSATDEVSKIMEGII